MSDELRLAWRVDDSIDVSHIPKPEEAKRWLLAALQAAEYVLQATELSVQVVTPERMIELNGQYRQQPKPTNVLSFSVDLPPGVPLDILGDIVICADVVANEAETQTKALQAHWAHMLVHGCLHLLGYDHVQDDEAKLMEGLETVILQQLQFPNPYEAL